MSFKATPLDVKCYRDGRRQSWYDVRILQVDVNTVTHKCRTSICRNAYDFQCSAKFERWNGSEWKTVVDEPFAHWPEDAAGVSYIANTVPSKTFDALVGQLLAKAIMVLS